METLGDFKRCSEVSLQCIPCFQKNSGEDKIVSGKIYHVSFACLFLLLFVMPGVDLVGGGVSVGDGVKCWMALGNQVVRSQLGRQTWDCRTEDED